jgi:RHS repeat-associated protein
MSGSLNAQISLKRFRRARSQRAFKRPRTRTKYTYYNCATGSECGRVRTITDALGHTTTYNAYDANGLPVRITDPNGTVTVLIYDLRQHLQSRTVGTEQTQFAYWPTGLLKKVTLPDGSYLSYIYDNAHRLTEIDDASGARTVFVLDAAGNRQQDLRYDPSNTLAQTQTRLYNTLGQLWQELTSAGTDAQSTVFGYDNQGNQTAINSPLSRNTANTYDSLNRLSQVTDPAGGITQFGYDAADNVTTVTDPRQLVTSYRYNGLGDLAQLQSPDTGTTMRTFDSAGNLSTVTDARGQTATYSFDPINRVTQIAYSDQTIQFAYDQGANAVGRLSSITDNFGQTSFGYDSLGHVNSKTNTVGGVSLPVSYVYQNRQLTSLTTPSGQSVTYTYNGNNRIASISVNGSPIISGVTYIPFGPTSGWTWGNGTRTTRSYDLDTKLAQISSAGASTYTFYDDRSISSRSDDWATSYDLPSGASNVTIAPASNQIASTAGTLSRTYSYDTAGNVTNMGGTSFGYNAAGRMTLAIQGAATTTFSVNAMGQRVGKGSATGTTLFAYDEVGHLLGEYTGRGALIEETVWFDDIPVATLRPNSAHGVDVFYIHTDHLNTPRRISRPVDNVVIWRWDSDPFGAAMANEDPDGDGQLFVYNLRLPGQYYDQETALNYNYFRDYDPAMGRYIESDPIGLKGGINPYGYVNGGPVMGSDPRGLLVEVIGHPAAAPFGRITNPTSFHAALYLKPDDACHCSGTWPLTLGAQPIGGKLVGAPNFPGDAFKNAQFQRVVKPPDGMSDCDFIRALISAAASYENSLPYSFPNISLVPGAIDGFMEPGQYNSNSFVSGVLGAVGATPPSIFTSPLYQFPGYQNPIPLPPQR